MLSKYCKFNSKNCKVAVEFAMIERYNFVRLQRLQNIINKGIKLRAEIRIRDYIKDHSLIKSDVAKRMGMQPWTFSRILNGKRNISADELERLSKVLGVSADYLLSYQKAED